MNKIKKMLKKLSPIVVACLTMTLAINANSASCFLINEPKEPKSVDKFKLF